MAKPKAQTIQQRFGFMDDDLKKPKHDDVMKWLYSSVDEMLSEWLGLGSEWTPEEIANLKQSATTTRHEKIQQLEKELKAQNSIPEDDPFLLNNDRLAFNEKEKRSEEYKARRFDRISSLQKQIECASGIIKGSAPPAKPPLRITEKRWEVPIKSNSYVIGFIDMSVKFEIPELSISVGMADIGWDAEWKIDYSSYSGYGDANQIYFEVKTEIPSLGELIRQINMYKSYGAKRFFVVAPDDSHAELLKEQGIGFIMSPKGI